MKMIEIDRVVKVGIADLNYVKAPQTIKTLGLGSCVGVVLYDEVNEIAGLAHIMLPESSLALDSSILNKAKYGDTAVEELMNLIVFHGARKKFIKAKMAGGAQMFHFISENEMMRIGYRNVEIVKKELERLQVKLIAEDVGGHNGRTIEFSPKTCMLKIKTVNLGVREI